MWRMLPTGWTVGRPRFEATSCAAFMIAACSQASRGVSDGSGSGP